MKTGCALKSTRPLVASVVVMMAIVLTHASTLYQRGKRKPGACWQTQSMDEPQVEAVRRQLKHPVEHAQRSTCPQSQRRGSEAHEGAAAAGNQTVVKNRLRYFGTILQSISPRHF